MFIIVSFISIIDSVVMIIPNSNDLSAGSFHFIVEWETHVFVFGNDIFVGGWEISAEKGTDMVGVCGVATPDEEIWIRTTDGFKNIV